MASSVGPMPRAHQSPLPQSGPFTLRIATLLCLCLLHADYAQAAFDNVRFAFVTETIRAHSVARQAVQTAWTRDSDDRVCASAGIHGFVNKEASGADNKYLYKADGEALAAFREAGVPIYSAIQVFISHKYKFIFIRQPKSSSTSILAAIAKLYCSGHPCRRHEFRQEYVEARISREVWRTYFVFTCVRNPIARMISAYIMFNKFFLYTRANPNSKTPGPKCNLPFPEFAQDAYKLQRICAERRCCSFITGDINKWDPFFPSPHITQQAHVVFNSEGKSIVDYIARTENIAADWPEIVQQISARSGRDVGTVPITNANGHHVHVEVPERLQHPCLLPDVMALEIVNKDTVFLIAQQYAIDMQWLQYTTPAASSTE